MYPQKGEYSRKYNERDLDREVSKITKNLEDFLYYYFSREKEVEKNMLLVQKYSDWGLDEWSAQLIQDTDAILSEYHYNDAVKLAGYKLQYQLIFLKKKSQSELGLEQYTNFMSDWISQAMYQICTMNIKPIKDIKNEELPLFPKEIVLKWMETNHEIVQKKDIQLFYKAHLVYEAFSKGKGKIKDIRELATSMKDFENYPQPDKIKNIFRILFHAANFLLGEERLHFLWELYTLGVQSQLMLVKGLIAPQDWLNINRLKILLKISDEQWMKEIGDLPWSKKTLEVYERLLAKVNVVEAFFQQANFQKVIKIYTTETAYEKIYDDYYKFQIKIYYFLAKYVTLNKSMENYYETVQHFKQELIHAEKQIERKLPPVQKTKLLNTLAVLILLTQKNHVLSRRKSHTEIDQKLANYFKENNFEMYEKDSLAKQIT
jgi:hypothetical protein